MYRLPIVPMLHQCHVYYQLGQLYTNAIYSAYYQLGQCYTNALYITGWTNTAPMVCLLPTEPLLHKCHLYYPLGQYYTKGM